METVEGSLAARGREGVDGGIDRQIRALSLRNVNQNKKESSSDVVSS